MGLQDLGSIVSFWEMAIKIAKGKLRVDLQSVMTQAQQSNFSILAISTDHILALTKLEEHHQDPFDRMLVAQAISEPLHLVSHDKILEQYSKLVILV